MREGGALPYNSPPITNHQPLPFKRLRRGPNSAAPAELGCGSHGQRPPARGLFPQEEPTVNKSLTVATRFFLLDLRPAVACFCPAITEGAGSTNPYRSPSSWNNPGCDCDGGFRIQAGIGGSSLFSSLSVKQGDSSCVFPFAESRVESWLPPSRPSRVSTGEDTRRLWLPESIVAPIAPW